MTRTKRITSVAFAAVPLIALAVAGCGGGSNASVPPAAAAAPAAPKTPTSRTAAVRVANSGLGKILVDSHGRTLYLFKKDTGTKSTCTGACAQAWPPLHVTGKPTVGSGARSSLLGTTQRSDGTRQVTYNGHPLYGFQGDNKRGDTNGEGLVAFGAAWFLVSPAGNQVAGKASSSAHASKSAKPAPKPTPPPAAKPAPKPTPPPAAKPAPKPTPPPAAKPAPKKASPPSSSGIPQNNGGDQDADNNGGPDDGDGGI